MLDDKECDMFSKRDLCELCELVKKEYSKNAEDISDALNLLKLALEEFYGALTKTVNVSMKNYNLGIANESIELSQLALNIITEINSLSTLLVDDNDYIDKTIDEEPNRKETPNYADYKVESSVPHSLDEDFIHKRPCGFSIEGAYYKVNSMREILVRTCTILATRDLQKFNSLVEDKNVKGRKNHYFGFDEVVENGIPRNQKVPGTMIYVWVNFNCNQIRDVLVAILKKFDVKLNKFWIYLKADYSDLHI